MYGDARPHHQTLQVNTRASISPFFVVVAVSILLSYDALRVSQEEQDRKLIHNAI